MRSTGYSGGTPRVINTLCDNALFEAFLARQETIGGERVERIGRNLGLAPNRDVVPPGIEQPASPATSRGRINLAEIDRYLEGLGKLST